MRGLDLMVVVGVIVCAVWLGFFLGGMGDDLGLVGVFGFVLVVGGLAAKYRPTRSS